MGCGSLRTVHWPIAEFPQAHTQRGALGETCPTFSRATGVSPFQWCRNDWLRVADRACAQLRESQIRLTSDATSPEAPPRRKGHEDARLIHAVVADLRGQAIHLYQKIKTSPIKFSAWQMKTKLQHSPSRWRTGKFPWCHEALSA